MILHLMNRGAMFACGTMDCEENVTQRQSSEIVYRGPVNSDEVPLSGEDDHSSCLKSALMESVKPSRVKYNVLPA